MNLEQFDKIANHLIKQGKRSKISWSGDYGMCAYRGEGGTKCAIGAVIPDHLYNEKMESRTFATLLIDFPELKPYLYPLTANAPIKTGRAVGYTLSVPFSWGMLLQLVHDTIDPTEWPALLAELRTYVEQTEAD